MKKTKYKIFFTISFLYKVDKKKSVTKFFKSDIDIDISALGEKLNDANVFKKWEIYALKANINELNPPENFIVNNIITKKIVTHRIINLMNLTEVF
tara:strand:+ start:368 stop:655 length:288 start_codon:yes stop_codon:yes gene_type:complete